MDNMTGGSGMVCKCNHHKVVPMMVFLIGLVLLLGALNILSSNLVSILWPAFLTIAGFMKMMEGKCKCC